jgi:hypothetical protein
MLSLCFSRKQHCLVICGNARKKTDIPVSAAGFRAFDSVGVDADSRGRLSRFSAFGSRESRYPTVCLLRLTNYRLLSHLGCFSLSLPEKQRSRIRLWNTISTPAGLEKDSYQSALKNYESERDIIFPRDPSPFTSNRISGGWRRPWDLFLCLEGYSHLGQ